MTIPPENLPESTPETSGPGIVLSYESGIADAAQRRPRWVYLVVTVYLLLLCAVATSPAWMIAVNAWDVDKQAILAMGIVMSVMMLLGLGLMMTPIRARRRRPMTRRSIWVPILCSGLLSGFLVFGALIALDELAAPGIAAKLQVDDQASSPTVSEIQDRIAYGVIGTSIAAWIGWGVLFGMMARRGDPTGIGMRLHRWLIAGSALELVVAVPSHIIVRRRGECCGGILTGTGICLGVVIALIAFGPSVFLLFTRYARSRAIIRSA